MTQEQINGLRCKHRAEKLSLLHNKKYDANYFSRVHRRSIARIYDAWNGKATLLRLRMDKHLDKLEQKEGV